MKSEYPHEFNLPIIEYEGIKSIGKVVRTYNNGETLNVFWNDKETAFIIKMWRK